MKGKSEIKSTAKSTAAQGQKSTQTKKDITAQSSTANQANKVTDDSSIGRSSANSSRGGRKSSK